MGLGIYPVFKPKVPKAKFNALGEVLVANLDALDEIADAGGLTRLTAFADNREIPDDFDGPPEELEDLLGPWDEWFDAEAGAAAFHALARHVAESPASSRRLDDAEGVVEELKELERVVRIAAARGAKFRLEVS